MADMLDTKVRNADEVGKVVAAPLLGDFTAIARRENVDRE